MNGELLIPAVFIVAYYVVRQFEDMKKWLAGPLLSAPVLLSVSMGLDLRYVLAYGIFAMLSAFDTKGIYPVIFGTFFAYVAYAAGDRLLAVLPLSIVALALPLADLTNRLAWRSERGALWTALMYALSAGTSALVLTSLGPVNPLWGLFIGAVATWSARLDRHIALPTYVFASLGFLGIGAREALMGFGFSLIASSLAYYLDALDINGLVGAVLLGTFLYAFSPGIFTALLAFLVSASILGRFARHDERFQEKGHRTAIQVMSNTFAAVLAGLLFMKGYPMLGAAIAAVAAATADTWATELGSLSRRKPRLITTMKIVEPGMSGGVTLLGLAGSAAAGLFIALVSYPFFGTEYFMYAFLGAVVGSLADSFIGAALQGIFRCRACDRLTEREQHCGKSTLLERGIWWLNNDIVNILATLIAMVVAL